jgi:hypothetical protein
MDLETLEARCAALEGMLSKIGQDYAARNEALRVARSWMLAQFAEIYGIDESTAKRWKRKGLIRGTPLKEVDDGIWLVSFMQC